MMDIIDTLQAIRAAILAEQASLVKPNGPDDVEYDRGYCDGLRWAAAIVGNQMYQVATRSASDGVTLK